MLKTLDSVRITNWTQLQTEFLKKFYPISRTNQSRKALTNFQQQEGEQFHEPWERLKEIMRKCPHHQVPKWQLVQSFYEGLKDSDRQMIDASCGGTFLLKSEDEGWNLFEVLGENSLHHASSGRQDKSSGMREGLHDLSVVVGLQSKVDLLTRKLDQILAIGLNQNQINLINYVCQICSDPSHSEATCPSTNQFPDLSQDQDNAVHQYNRPRNDPYTNTYNLGWRNHPNFSWNQNNHQGGGNHQAGPSYQKQNFIPNQST